MSAEECAKARVAIKATVLVRVRDGLDKDAIADGLIGTAVQMLIQYMPPYAVAQAFRDTANIIERPN